MGLPDWDGTVMIPGTITSKVPDLLNSKSLKAVNPLAVHAFGTIFDGERGSLPLRPGSEISAPKAGIFYFFCHWYKL